MANYAAEKKVGGWPSSPYGPWLLMGGVGLMLLSFTAGRLSTTSTLASEPTIEASSASEPGLLLVQNLDTSEDSRELIPLPGPGVGPDMQPGEEECPVYLYQDGQLYRLMPGQPDGQAPGRGGSRELFPLEPLPRTPPSPPEEPSPPRPRTFRT